MTRKSTSSSALVRAAEALIEQRNRAASAPVAVWMPLDMSAREFAERLIAYRAQRTGRILAAVPYGFSDVPGIDLVPFAPKLFSLLHPRVISRYRKGSGGRGSGKSHGFADAVVLRCLSKRIRVLCAREIMLSLKESVHHLLTEKIEAHGLHQYFDITDRSIICIPTRSEIIFRGLYANINSLKSLENISLVWVEEAESISSRSLEILSPTIRAEDSEIWLSCNPDDPKAPIESMVEGTAWPDLRSTHVTFLDNPWFPKSLEGERARMERVDADLYAHVWEGKCRLHSDAQILKGKYSVADFTPTSAWDGPYQGIDFGFSQDPTVLIRCWVFDSRLYVEHEVYGVAIDLINLPTFFDRIPDARKYVSRADSSRPETISHLQHHGYGNVVGVEKWSGSVEDGVAHLRSYEQIIIHSRCTRTIDEARLYSFKVDRLSGDVLPDIVDKFNHCMDALRYVQNFL